VNANWSIVERAAQLLSPDEREMVLGDLCEAGEGPWRGVLDIAGLLFRREALLWTNWGPWLASFGLALPASFLLMGFSLTVTRSYLHAAIAPSGIPKFAAQSALLVAWAWTGGLVVGAISARTLWASLLCCFAPCLFCLSRFRVPHLSSPCLLLFLIPALGGLWRGLRGSELQANLALALATAITFLTAIHAGLWSLHWLLVWPAWYLAMQAEGIRA
jgi:hypothetical protein